MKQLHKYGFLTLAMVFGLSMIGSAAQETRFRARLSPMPVTPQTVDSITGGGEVHATLNGTVLSIAGSFRGTSSVATAAHVHNGPKAIPGPPVHPLEVTNATSGDIHGELDLTPEQVEAFNNEALYIQVHTETNPGGELRGWLLPE
ncbi:MAG: CHRD domain-containing protein [Pseudohongiellaceae bacterium]